jgi:hypothetical protein
LWVRKDKILRFLSLLLMALPVFFLPGLAHAQNAMTGYSETEKVGFAFYHLINRNPPYEDWIMNRDDYLKAEPFAKLEILDHDRARLRDGFAAYFPDRDLIKVKVNLLYDVSDNPDNKAGYAQDENAPVKRINIHFPVATGGTYFPFQIGKLWVGLVPDNAEAVFQQDMTLKKYTDFCASIGNCSNFRDKVISTVIVMRPASADAKTPFVDNGIPIWLMMTDVGALYIRNDSGDNKWSYTVPWYDTQQAQQFMSLMDPKP